MPPKKKTAAIDLSELVRDADIQRQNQASRFDLQDLVDKGEELEKLCSEADVLLRKLDAKNEQIRVLQTETIPDMMKSLNLKDLTLMSGASISLVDIIKASITDEHREEAHRWLREHNHGDIIKNNLTLSFGKGEDDYAAKITDDLLQMRREGLVKFGDLVQKEAVHYQTLQAFVKQRLAAGEEFPNELFGLYTGHTVKFKEEK